MSILLFCAALVAVTAAVRLRRASVVGLVLALASGGAMLAGHVSAPSRLAQVAASVEREAHADTQLGVPNGPVVLGGSFGVSVPTGGWTPEKASPPPTFDLDPGTGSTLTLSGSTVTHATSRGGGSYTLIQSGSAALPTLDSTHTIGGYATLSFTATGALYSAAGPAIGSDTPFTLYAVTQLVTNVGTSYPAVATLGSSAAAVDQSVFLGGRTTQWWAGSQDSTHLGAVGGTVNSSAHILGLEYDGAGNFKIRVDGVLAGGPTAGTFNAHTTFPTGFGVAPQYSGNTTTFRLARAIYRLAGLDSTTVRRQHEWYLAKTYGLIQTDEIMGVGDSLTHGTGSSNPPATGYLGQLTTYLPGWTYNYFDDGHPGDTATQIAAVMTSQNLCSGARRNSIVILFAGTNDVAQSISTATTTGALASMKSTLEGAGCTVLMGTLYPWDGVQPFGWNQSAADAINTWIRSNVAATKIVEWANTPEMQLSAGTYQPTYRNCDLCSNAGHPTDAGYVAMARDAAPVLLANKMSIGGEPVTDNGRAWGSIGALAALVIAQRRRRKAA